MTEEVRVTCASTGGQKGSKPFQMSYIPVECLNEIMRLYHEGAKKYAKNNWQKGYDWDLSYDAGMRHFMQFWDGESLDEETGCSHLASVVFHAIALMYFEKHHPELDTRPSKPKEPELNKILDSLKTTHHDGAVEIKPGDEVGYSYNGKYYTGVVSEDQSIPAGKPSTFINIETGVGTKLIDKYNILEVVS